MPVASRAVAAASQSSSTSLQEIALDRDPPLDRVLAAAPEQVLDPPRGPGGEVERIASTADLRSARRTPFGCLGAAQRLERLARGSHRAPEPDVDGVAALTLGLSGDLGGQRAQRGAAALELVAKMVAAGGECVGASRKPLARGTEAGQAPPGLGALAVAVGKPSLDLRPLLGDDGEIGLDRVRAASCAWLARFSAAASSSAPAPASAARS